MNIAKRILIIAKTTADHVEPANELNGGTSISELVIALQPKQQQFRKVIEDTPCVLFGGARGGGKSHGLRSILLLRRFQYPGSVGAIFRKTYPELEGNHIGPIFREYPQFRKYYNEAKKVLSLPNGSTIEFCYCENEKDLERYQGREYHDLGIDEVGQWTETMFHRLRGSNRSSIPGIRPRTIMTGNPGGVGHGWLKRLFIERRFNQREEGSDYAFVQALVTDNEALMDSDPQYLARLDAEPNEMIRAAYRFGSWDLMAGQFFGEIRREVHFIEPFPIPPHWNRFGAYDFGYNHPAAFGWFACDSDGNVYLYREIIKAGLRIDQFIQEILKYPDIKQLYPIVAGHDCWAKRNAMIDKNPPTIAEEFKKQDIILKQATIDRIQGASQVRNYLAWQNLASGRDRPKLFIFNTCPIAFDTLSRMQNDPARLEDVLKVDAIEGDPMTGDDAYDMIRYALMSRPMLTDEPKVKHPHGSQEWAKQQVTEMEQAAEEHFENLAKQETDWTRWQ